MTDRGACAPRALDNLPFEIILVIFEQATIHAVESWQLAWVASVCLVSVAIDDLVRPILYRTLVVTKRNLYWLQKSITSSLRPHFLGDVHRLYDLNAFSSWIDMPDELLHAYDPSKLVAVSMQTTGFQQLCSSPLFLPPEVHFRMDMLDFIRQHKELHSGLSAATHVLACFPHISPAQAHPTDERMRAALATLPAVTHLALHIPADARTPNMYRLNERTIEPPDFMRCTLETVLREERIVMLVVDVTELDESHQKATDRLIRELADDRLRMLVDERPRYWRWENDWQLGRGVWDGHESVYTRAGVA